MTHQAVSVALWGGLGSQVLLQRLLDKPLLQRTLARVEAAKVGRVVVLVPWAGEHDALEQEILSWKRHVLRGHADERIAMRDLVALERTAHGVLVQGHAADVDVCELLLAIETLRHGQESYKSHRIAAYRAEDWLRARDSEEWGPIRSLEELRALYSHPSLLDDDTRAIRARVGRAP